MPDKMLTLKCENHILWQSGEDDVFTCAVQKQQCGSFSSI